MTDLRKKLEGLGVAFDEPPEAARADAAPVANIALADYLETIAQMIEQKANRHLALDHSDAAFARGMAYAAELVRDAKQKETK